MQFERGASDVEIEAIWADVGSMVYTGMESVIEACHLVGTSTKLLSHLPNLETLPSFSLTPSHNDRLAIDLHHAPA